MSRKTQPHKHPRAGSSGEHHEYSHSHSHGHSNDHGRSHTHVHPHDHAHPHSHSHSHGHSHTHEHTHNHAHDHFHNHSHDHPHAHSSRRESQRPQRSLPESFNTLYLEPIGGIAGDMFLAACLDLGVNQDELERQLASLKLSGYRLERRDKEKAGILGTHLDVVLEKEQPHHRAYSEIVGMIEKSGLSSKVKEAAQKVFRIIGEAEAHVHGVSIEDIHFHEVGAVDAIVDICGAAICLELLGWPRLLSLPPPAGAGTVHAAHGVIPVPAPATIEIMRGRKMRPSGPGERTTPTGAGLLKALAQEVDAFPDFVIEQVGYGLGTKDFADAPNVLRAVLGRQALGHGEGEMSLVEANLDDTTGEVLAHALDALLTAGAADVWITPILGKKGRPAQLLSALVDSSHLLAVQDRLFAELPTLGVRSSRCQRRVLDRRWEEVSTPWGSVRIKLGLNNGTTLHAAPEYEDCLKRAREGKVPVVKVLQHALAAWSQSAQSKS